MRRRGRRDARVFRRLDPAVSSAASRWAEAMGSALRELTPEAASGAADAYLAHEQRDLTDEKAREDVRAVFRAEAEHRASRIRASLVLDEPMSESPCTCPDACMLHGSGAWAR